MASSSQEERLNHLEESVFFQETALAHLNDALTRQQMQLDALEKRLSTTEAQVKRLLVLLEDGGEASLPPHSLPERW